MKKGFTLIEMIGVMVILSLLMLFAMPNVINYIKKGGDTEDKIVKTMIYEASKQYITDNQKVFKKDSKNTYCISLNTLATEGYIESPITLSSSDEDITSETSTKAVKVTYDKNYKYELTDECVGIVNPTPILYSGLTPVMYDGTNWVVANPKTDEWYDYDKQMWANAVVLGSGKTKKPGEVVTVEGDAPDALMMLVWIPRYEYKIEGTYGTHLDGTEGTMEEPGEIKVNFLGTNTTTPTNGYRIHPAFEFGNSESDIKHLSGIWVGKFELSSTSTNTSDDNNLGCNQNGCTGNISNLRILPNVASLRKNNVSNFWYGIKEIENTSSFGLTTLDTHMMKNSEWGAVAYLSQSKYGKYGNTDYNGVQKEVYINNSSKYYTGRSGGNPAGSNPINETYTEQTSTDQYNDYGYYTYDGYLLSYNTNNKIETRDINKGTGASTTGNIYGIYDMSGGTTEYIMGVYSDGTDIYSGLSISSNSGFNGKTGENVTLENGLPMPSRKYYDIYLNPTNNTNYDATQSCKIGQIVGICYGHALSETYNWYTDAGMENSIMVNSNKPWLVRGSNYFNYNQYNKIGVFNRSITNGSSSSITTRVVFSGK